MSFEDYQGVLSTFDTVPIDQSVRTHTMLWHIFSTMLRMTGNKVPDPKKVMPWIDTPGINQESKRIRQGESQLAQRAAALSYAQSQQVH